MAVPVLGLTGLPASPAIAQPADLPISPATTSEYPTGIKIANSGAGKVYADKRGLTLYGMDMRTLIRWNPDPAKFCSAECAEQWEPLFAPKDAKPNIMFPRGFGERRAAPGAPPPGLPAGFVGPQSAPDWTIIDGASGPQWVYKGWHMVYSRKGEPAGSAAHDGADQQIWNTLKFVPPVPSVVAPASVTTQFAGGAYLLADRQGRALFTGQCAAACAGWLPLTAPMAGQGLGEWSVSLAGDSPQWAWRGQPVYVSREADPLSVPRNGKVLRP